MIKRIHWNRPILGESESPFQIPYENLNDGKERPLRIFFHSSSFNNLSPEERQALNMLLDLSGFSILEAINTEKGDLPYIEFSPYEKGAQNVPFIINKKESIRHGAVYAGQFQQLLPILMKNGSLLPVENEQVENDLLVVRACAELRQDILVTSSPTILSNWDIPFVADQNPMLPSDALKIVGLFLRSKGKYTYKCHSLTNEGAYYLGLANSLLPDFWYYLSICGASEPVRKDDIVYLSQSIFTRCVRVLMALDEIGYQFYVPQNNDTEDNIMYHFDYLTILLSGALDAEACIAYRAYQLTKPKSERFVGFKNEEFLKELEKTKGKLSTYITKSQFNDLIQIVSLLRNTIHSTRMSPIAYRKIGDQKKSLARLPQKIANELLTYCIKFASKDEWGFVTLGDILCIEPFSFARNLVLITFDVINSTARQTDLNGLFIDGSKIPVIVDNRATNDEFLFGENAVQSFRLLM